MAKPLKSIATETLATYQQLLDFSSREMHGMFQQMIEALNKGDISKEFHDKMEESFRTRIEKNNEVSVAIDIEINKRIIHTFGSGMTTMKEMPRFGALFQEEVKSHKMKKDKRLEEIKDKTGKLKLIPTKEKKV